MDLDFNSLLTAGSIVAAVIVGIYQIRKQRLAADVQHTIDILAMTFEDSAVSRSRSVLRKWIIADRYIKDDRLPPDDDEVVATILNYYDFLASLVLIDDLDLRVFRQTMGGVVVRDFEYLKCYVISRRESSGRPLLYWNIEAICRDHLLESD